MAEFKGNRAFGNAGGNYRFNGKVYETAEEFRAAMLEAARARPELHPEGRPVEDDPNKDPGPFAGRRSREGFELP